MAVDALVMLASIGEPVLHLEGTDYLTPPGLLKYGMCACSSCGHIMSIDNDRCHSCGEPKFYLLDKSTLPFQLTKTV